MHCPFERHSKKVQVLLLMQYAARLSHYWSEKHEVRWMAFNPGSCTTERTTINVQQMAVWASAVKGNLSIKHQYSVSMHTSLLKTKILAVTYVLCIYSNEGHCMTLFCSSIVKHVTRMCNLLLSSLNLILVPKTDISKRDSQQEDWPKFPLKQSNLLFVGVHGIYKWY